MLNLCHISSLKRQKVCAFVLIICLISGLTPTAESISVKLRGKIVLGGILSGLAYATYALVKRDKRAVEKLQLHLGPPERVIQFERGFDRWRVNSYGEQCYLFRNNLFIKTVPCADIVGGVCNPDFRALHTVREVYNPDSRSLFLIDTPVSKNPTWLQLSLLRPQRAPQFVSSYLYPLEAERLLGPRLLLSR